MLCLQQGFSFALWFVGCLALPTSSAEDVRPSLSTCVMQVRRLESQIAQAEAQAHTAEEACAQLQREVQQLTQTLEETGAASELHVQVCP